MTQPAHAKHWSGFISWQALMGLAISAGLCFPLAGALLGYIEATQVGNMPRLLPLIAVSHANYMEIDPATRRSLELSRTLTGERRGSLTACS